MTLLVPDLATDPMPGHRPRALRALAAGSPGLTATGLLLLLLLVPLALASLADPRTVSGHAVWDKPMRFALALGLYALTLAFFAGWIDGRARAGRLFRVSVAIGIAAILFEQGWITLQAARGTTSHFNMGTPVEAAMWALMGIGALLLTALSTVIGWLLWRAPRAGLAPALRAGGALGLGLTLPLTLLTAGTLAALGGSSVGTPSGADAGLALMGWSREIGDLRVPHFFATHALHAVPLAAALLIPLLGRDRMAPSVCIAAGYALFVLAVFAQALSSRPFL